MIHRQVNAHIGFLAAAMLVIQCCQTGQNLANVEQKGDDDRSVYVMELLPLGPVRLMDTPGLMIQALLTKARNGSPAGAQ